MRGARVPPSPNLHIHQPSVPQPLPEVPPPAGDAIQKPAFQEITDAEIHHRPHIPRQPVVLRLTRILKRAGYRLFCLTLRIAAMLLFPLPRLKIRTCRIPFVACRISPPINFRFNSNVSPATSSGIARTPSGRARPPGAPQRSRLRFSIVSSVKYSSASKRKIQEEDFPSALFTFSLLLFTSNCSSAQLNCTACVPGHL